MTTSVLRHGLLAACLCTLAPLAAAQTAPSELLSPYNGYIVNASSATAWYGDRVALVLEGEVPGDRDAGVMYEIVSGLDAIFDAYDFVVGRTPPLNAPLNGKIRIEYSPQVGGGLASHGSLGVAIGYGFFANNGGLYDRVASGTNTYDQVLFYEIARNYWFSDMNPRIDYMTTSTSGPSGDYGWWTVGFNNAMAIFLPEIIDEIDDMYYFGSNGASFAAGMENNLNIYLASPQTYTWDNSWNVNLVPWSPVTTSLNDLMTGLLVRLHRDHGGIDFIRGLYENIPLLAPVASKVDHQGARDNFYLAATLAAGEDLCSFFESTLRWDLSPSACTPVPPVLVDVQPQQIQGIQSGILTVTLTATDLGFAQAAYLDGQLLDAPYGVVTQSGDQVTLSLPPPTALGSFDLTVENIVGVSTPISVDVVETDPAQLLAPPFALTTAPYSVKFGAGANDVWVLLAGASDATAPLLGFDLLDPVVILDAGLLDGLGVGQWTVSFSAGTVGKSFWLQMVGLDAGTLGLEAATAPQSLLVLL